MDFYNGDLQIHANPPFVRPKVPITAVNKSGGKAYAVLGVSADVYPFSHLSEEGVSKCCGKIRRIPIYKRRSVGSCFFYDIDVQVPKKELTRLIQELMYAYDLSHLIYVNTYRGHHLYCLEYKPKIEWYSLFRNCQALWPGDYEFQIEWVLRIGARGWIPAPNGGGVIPHFKVQDRFISGAHLTILEKNIGLPEVVRCYMKHSSIIANTYAHIVQYRSWNVPAKPEV